MEWLRRLVSWLRALWHTPDNRLCDIIGRRGSCVIYRDRKTFMFYAVDMHSDAGPELLGTFAIYRNAVTAAEQRKTAAECNRPTDVRG